MSHYYYYFLCTPELRRNSLGLIPELSHVWNLTGSLTIEVLFLLGLFNEKEGEWEKEEDYGVYYRYSDSQKNGDLAEMNLKMVFWFWFL